MKLQELAALLVLSNVVGDPSIEIKGLQTDSRRVKPGDLFICLQGANLNGHDYVAEAENNGAAALLVEQQVKSTLPRLVVQDSRFAMAVIANHFYQYPSHRLKLIGVTGTNGKTTITYLLDKIFSDHGLKTGLMGTIQMRIGEQSYQVQNTTQDAIDLQRALYQMTELNTDYCFMEVSSHALHLGRVKGCRFRTAIFTNLSQDHLDYHGSMKQYREAKGLMFSRMGNEFYAAAHDHQFVILNADDEASNYYKQLTSAQVITYGIDGKADVYATDIRISSSGTELTLHTFRGDCKLHMQLMGRFSVYNALAAVTAALLEGIPLESIKHSLEQVTGVDGRFELVKAGQPFVTIVDYAHTPDGLENVLRTIREFAEGNIYCVFGCGGDRDRTKRPLMGAIAAKYSDYILITSDNPRTEEPMSIIHEIEQGLLQAGFPGDRYECIEDRQQAIEKAIVLASSKDVVLIAGKGHETYQEVNGVRSDFDDRLVAHQAIRRLKL